MNATVKKTPAAAPAAPPKTTAEPSPLLALRAEAEPLAARLATVDADLATLGAAPALAPAGGETISLEAAIAARKAGVQKRADLTAERDVIAERLAPIQSRIAELEAEEQEQLKIARREESLTIGREALERVRSARGALEREIEAFAATVQTTPVRINMLPEMHFEAQEEVGEIVRCARGLAV